MHLCLLYLTTVYYTWLSIPSTLDQKDTDTAAQKGNNNDLRGFSGDIEARDFSVLCGCAA